MRSYFKCLAICVVVIGFSSANAGSYEDFFAALKRDEPQVARGILLAKPACELVPVHAGKPDVEQRDRWHLGPGELERGWRILRGHHLVTEMSQQLGEQDPGIVVVVDDEDPCSRM